MVKICKVCGLLKHHNYRDKKKGTFQSRCKECQSKQSHSHYERNKQAYVKKANKHRKSVREVVRKLKEVPCADCGVQYPYYVMQFDHLEDKKYHLSEAEQHAGVISVLEEAEKCEVVCANCHAERTHQRKLNRE